VTDARLGAILGATWFLSIWTIGVVSVFFTYRAVTQLNYAHKDVWASLGLSEDWSFTDSRVVSRARSFIWSKKCLDVGDAKLTQLRRLSFVTALTSAVLFLAFSGFVVWAVFFIGF